MLGPFSEEAGDGPKPSVVLGDAACEDGVGRDLGEAADKLPACIGGSVLKPGSTFGAMLEVDRRLWCLLSKVLDIGGGCIKFAGIWVGPKLGLPCFAWSSACTSMPFSRRIRSSSEFLYLSIRHSSAAVR